MYLFTSQKSILCTREKKNESNHNVKDSHQITREERKEPKGAILTRKQLTKWQYVHTYQ